MSELSGGRAAKGWSYKDLDKNKIPKGPAGIIVGNRDWKEEARKYRFALLLILDSPPQDAKRIARKAIFGD